MRNENKSFDELMQEEIKRAGRVSATEGFQEKHSRRDYAESRLTGIVNAAVSHAEENYKSLTLMQEVDLNSIKTWPDGEHLDPDELKTAIRESGGRLAIMFDRESEDMETHDPSINDNSPIELIGAEYENGELILITDTNVYATLDFNDFERSLDIDRDEYDLEIG